MLIQDLKEPKYLFDYNNKPKGLTADEERSEVEKSILAARVSKYIKNYERLAFNMNRIYGIIWVKCIP